MRLLLLIANAYFLGSGMHTVLVGEPTPFTYFCVLLNGLACYLLLKEK